MFFLHARGAFVKENFADAVREKFTLLLTNGEFAARQCFSYGPAKARNVVSAGSGSYDASVIAVRDQKSVPAA